MKKVTKKYLLDYNKEETILSIEHIIQELTKILGDSHNMLRWYKQEHTDEYMTKITKQKIKTY